jgi:filamentous hemagglutinin
MTKMYGFDHVMQGKDGSTIIIMNKEFDNDGGVQLATTSVGFELSEAWIRFVLSNLAEDSPAKITVSKALADGTLKTAIAAINKSTGDLVITPIKVD